MQKKQALLLLQVIQEATQWLMGLTEAQAAGLQAPLQSSLRVFTVQECEYLPLSCRRFLLSLEQQGVLDAALRERIIHHALELRVKNVDLQVIEGITRILLSRQPQGASALARMELLMAEMSSRTVH